MKRTVSIFIFLALLSALAMAQTAPVKKSAPGRAQGRSNQPQSPDKLKYPPLRDWKVPEPTRVELSNGMIVYLLEDHELPVINLTAYIRAGGRWDPADKVGLADIAASAMRLGGTTSKTGDQLDDELERIAASVETSAGQDSGFASMSVLKEDLDTGLNTLADVLINPAFPDDKLELLKVQHRDGIARRNDNIGGVTDREFRRLVYGPDSPYARTEEYQTIDNITRADLIAFHKRYYHPNNMMVGIWGDFKVDEMKAKLESCFGKWQRTQLDLPPVPQVNHQQNGRIFYINKENVTQANVAIGHLGGKQSDPDYFLLLTLNRVLRDRFFSNIRDREGLAYSVSASWDAEYDAPGTFLMGGQTKSESTVKFVKTLLAEIDNVSKAEVKDEELTRAKEAILNSFIFNFDTTGEVVSRLLTYEYYGYPKDFLLRYKERVEKVTKADLLRVAKEYIRPENFTYLVAGKEKEFDSPLASLGIGQVATLDISIPEPKKPEVAAATPETLARGKSLLQAAQKAMGGEAFRQVKDLSSKADAKVITPQGEFAIGNETAIKYPNKIFNKLKVPFGEIIQAFDGQAGWLKSPQGTQDLSADDANQLRDLITGDMVYVLGNFDTGNFQAQFLEEATVDGRKTLVVLVTEPNQQTVKFYIDAENNMVLRRSFRSKEGGAPTETEETYSDFREVGGLRLPFKRSIKRNGKPFAEASITELKINSGVDDKVFAKQ